MDLTIGYLEDKFRKFPKNTVIHIGCGVCHHSASGSDQIVSIEDRTNQTYGYIELTLNDKTEGKVEVTKDEKLFYETEIARLKSTIVKQEKIIKEYADTKQSILSTIACNDKRIEWIKNGKM